MNDASLMALGQRLQQRGQWLAVAESCTGGLIAAQITDISGASAWFDRGVVTYSNRAKTELLGVPAALLVIPVGWFVWKYSEAVVPGPGEIETAQISSIYFNDGENELARLVPPEGNREQVALEAVPADVQDAVLAAEAVMAAGDVLSATRSLATAGQHPACPSRH